MNNKVLVIGADHHNTLGIVESLGEKGIKSYVLIVADIKSSFVLKSKYVIKGWICPSPSCVVDEMLKHFSDSINKTIVYSSYDNVSSVLDSLHIFWFQGSKDGRIYVTRDALMYVKLK